MVAKPPSSMKGFSFAAGALTVALVAAPGCDDGAAGVRTVGVASDRDAGQGAFPPGPDAGADATPRDATVVPVDGGAGDSPDVGSGDPPDVGSGDPPDTGGSAGPDASTPVPPQPDTGAGPDAVVAPVPVPEPDATPPAPGRDAAVAPVPAPDAAPPAVCGNGVLEAGEACDDGALRAGCEGRRKLSAGSAAR
ncbi:hypothetical protein L6V77_20415 [Myxococcota bacterium]|nr:hypothetical protein [Myxococcota bacterium]